MGESRTRFGKELAKAMQQMAAHRRGELRLPEQIVNPMRPEQIKAIRKSVAKSPREFERRFGVPARTLEGWEQGRKLDVAGRVLLTVIEREPVAVERALTAATKAGSVRDILQSGRVRRSRAGGGEWVNPKTKSLSGPAQRPNQRARREAPKASFSRRKATDGAE